MTVEEALQNAVAHHRANRLREAEQIYRQILAAFPDQPDSIHLLALIAAHLGRHAEAMRLGERTIWRRATGDG